VYYPSHATDVWNGPYAVEWNGDEIPARTSKEFSAEVKLRPGVKTVHGWDNPVEINQEKVLPIHEPDGTIVNQPKEGGTIAYSYVDQKGIPQSVQADLPRQTVSDLPPQWPYA
jgi:hypothetical protein